VKDRIDSAFTIIRSDALAFPTIGGLSSAVNRSRPRRDFMYDVSVRVPPGFVVATGGAGRHAANADGTTTWHYASGRPSPFLNVAIAPFDTLTDAGVRVFFFPADSAGARRLMASTQTALRTLAQWYGPLRTELNLAITEIPDGWGSQASLVGGIIQSAAAFRDSQRLGELYHELSHLWNAADTDRPSPPRWNEGLAMFVEHLLREQVDGWNGRAESETRLLERVKKRLAADSGLRRVPFADYGKHAMTDDSYSVGELMFATLHDLVGREHFNAIIGGYYQTHPAGGTTREFVAFAKQTEPMDLDAFFDDWLFTTRWTGVVATASSRQNLVDHNRSKASRTPASKPATRLR
jgi:aminopeptidase N